MSHFKDLYQAELEAIEGEGEESGAAMSEAEAAEKAHNRALDRYFAACDEAKDRAKYQEEPVT